MADYYTQFSFAIPLMTQARVQWATEVIAYLGKVSNGTWDPTPDEEYYAVLPDDPEFLSYNVEVEVVSGAPQLWVYSDEAGEPAVVVPLVQTFLRTFLPTESIAFTWAETCSRPQIDGFGGGAVLITAENAQWFGTGQWAYEKQQEHKGVFSTHAAS